MKFQNDTSQLPDPGTAGVFFVEAAGLIRIGWSPNGMRGRIRELAEENSVGIMVLGYVVDARRSLARSLYWRYRANVHHGKWLVPTPEMRADLALLASGARSKECSAPECERPYVARGYCRRHYSQLVERG